MNRNANNHHPDWNNDDDGRLIILINAQYGNTIDWKTISEYFNGRSAQECKQRWLDDLRPPPDDSGYKEVFMPTSSTKYIINIDRTCANRRQSTRISAVCVVTNYRQWFVDKCTSGLIYGCPSSGKMYRATITRDSKASLAYVIVI